jgi:hypothetical protein
MCDFVMPLLILLQMTPPPEYIQHRIDLFERLKAEYDAEVARMLPYLQLELQFR